MSIRQDISKETGFFVGTKKTIEFEVLQDLPGVRLADLPPEDVSGRQFKWEVRDGVTATSALISKVTGGGGVTITGVYNASRASNTQRVSVTVSAADTESLSPGQYSHALKRTDTGNEDIVSEGDFVLRQSAAH